MAYEIISTFTTTPYLLDASDSLYIADTGRILTNSASAPALSGRTSADNNLSVAIDGQVISVGTDAINLSRALATENGSNEVVIGASGLVRSVTQDAIVMVGYENSVFNAGEISSGADGISLTGNSCEAINAGTIWAESSCIQIEGDFVAALNSGDITGSATVVMRAGTGKLANSGTINSAIFGNIISVTAAVYVADFTNFNFENTGSITAATAAGTFFNGLVGAVLKYANHGQIVGNTYGSNISVSSTGQADIINGGLISGNTIGLLLGTGTFHVSNLEGGVIASTGVGISTGSVLRLHNSGTIAASGQDGIGIALGSGSAGSTIHNRGVISSNFDAAIDASGVATGGSVFLTNLGTIAGNYLGGAVADQVTNRGTMDAVFSNAGDDVVRNRGLVISYVLLGLGEDTYDGRRGEVGAWVDGGQDNDSLRGGAVEDDLRGGIGDDTLLGGDGDDILDGNAGLDVIQGGGGNDTIEAGADADLLTGGAGTDVFVWASAADAGTGAARDRITDFNNGNDVIDLSAFMAGASFIGSALFSAGAVGEVRYDAASGRISGDVDGDGAADWQIALVNKPALAAADFVF